MTRSSGLAGVAAAANAPRPLWLLLLISAVIGLFYAGLMLDSAFVLGAADVWRFPQGIVPGGANDMANSVVGYFAVVHAPWRVPLLFAPTLDAPRGLSAFWLEPLPWVALGGKLVFALTGRVFNLLGSYLFACLALNGVAMTLLLAAAGHRSLLAAVAGSVLALSTPWLLFRWGHPPLMGQFALLLSLALYLASQHGGRRLWIGAAWFGLVLLTLVTNAYLFAMVGAVWGASLIQRWLGGMASTGRVAAEAVLMLGAIAATMVVVGMIPPASGAVLSSEYGQYGLNLLTPVVPQMSGLVPPLAGFYIGQYEGFSYLGGGILLLVLAGARDGARWLGGHARRHVALLAIFVVMIGVAASNHITIGRLVFDVPLPEVVTRLLGTFRSAGRFVWVPAYAVMAGSIVMALRRRHAWLGMALLVVACCLQTIDAGPLRAAIRTSVRAAAPAVLDRAEMARDVAAAQTVRLFPSYGCIDTDPLAADMSQAAQARRRRIAMEVQVIAARLDKGTNSFLSGRPFWDCAAERTARQASRIPGTLYILMDGPDGEGTPCKGRDGYRSCFAPAP